MPSSRGRQTTTPVTVEVKPSDVGGSNKAPSSPLSSSPGSPSSPGKKARFPETPVDGVTRPLSPTESWSLYHFECHARKCHDCYNPYDVFRERGKLCSTGNGLAQDVAEHVYWREGEVYSKASDDYKQVSVELQPGYDQVRSLLKGMDRYLRSKPRIVPIISYDRAYPVSARRTSSSERRERRRDEEEYKTAIIEPGDSKRTSRRSSQKQKRYSTVVIDEDVQPQPSRESETRPVSRKGSLYDAEIQRQKKDKGYIVEIREPSSRRRDSDQRKKDDRRRSGYFHP